MARVASRAASLGRRHAAERHAHVAIDRVRGQQRLRIHGVHVVDAVKEGRLVSGHAEGAIDRVVQHDAAKAADVNRTGRRFRVVDYLRARDLGSNFVGPVHGGGKAS